MVKQSTSTRGGAWTNGLQRTPELSSGGEAYLVVVVLKFFKKFVDILVKAADNALQVIDGPGISGEELWVSFVLRRPRRVEK